MAKEFDVCMIGLGPVGTVSAACFAKQGFNVIGVDNNPARVSSFVNNEAPFVEPGVNELMPPLIPASS
jgi:GDP-mannose 6-dehydrogenase